MGEVMTKQVECERKCLDESNCQFYFFSENKLCILYSECNKYTKMSHIGRSYHKTGNDIWKGWSGMKNDIMISDT